MSFVFFAIFALIAAMLFNAISPKLGTYAAKNTKAAAFVQGYAGKTVLTAIGLFVTLFIAAFALSLIGKDASIPTA